MGQDASVLPRLLFRRTLLGIVYPVVFVGLALLLAEATAQIADRMERGSWWFATFPGDPILATFLRKLE